MERIVVANLIERLRHEAHHERLADLTFPLFQFFGKLDTHGSILRHVPELVQQLRDVARTGAAHS